ncbi:MAG: response regulator transcription factor [Bryobacteraceae bacterium]|jgi:DNA-binding NarL/FixJ family response regulator
MAREGGVIRVAVAARSTIVRAGLESMVRSSGSLALSDEASADVLLFDDNGGSLDSPALPTVALMDVADSSAVNSAVRSGVRGVISRDAGAEEIEAAVQAVHAGLVVVLPEFLQQLLPEAPPAFETLAEPLSDRELEVLGLLVEGLSNKLIAHRLFISEHTVKTHVTSILAKLGVSSRTEAVSQAIRRGLVML